jgi:hypothetical protein
MNDDTWATTHKQWRGQNGATQAWWTPKYASLGKQMYVATYGGDPKYYIQTSDCATRVNLGGGMDTLEEAQAVYLLMTN